MQIKQTKAMCLDLIDNGVIKKSENTWFRCVGKTVVEKY